MTYSLMTTLFSSYGAIEQSRPEACGEQTVLTLEPDAPTVFYRSPHPVRLEYLSGMTFLAIRTETGILFFYLDRDIRLHSNVEFGLLPLGQTSTVCMEARGVTASEPVSVAAPTEPSQALHLLTFLPQQSDVGFYFRGETHPPMELIYVQNGTIHHCCCGEEQLLRSGQLLLIGPHQWHMQYAEGGVRFLTIGFIWEGVSFSHLYNQVLNADSSLQKQLTELQALRQSSDPYRHELLNARLKLMLLDLVRTETPSPPRHLPSHRMKNQIVDHALQMISQHISEGYTVEELASSVNVSPAYLSTLFRQCLGTSPGKYMARVRLEECKSLLFSGQLNVSQIADRMGYSSVQHFSKQFRQWMGCSPSQFVKKHTK